MITLYPTETVYALGVNAFDEAAMKALYDLKAREAGKAVSVLVRDVADIERYAYVSPVALRLAQEYLPGPLTLVLRAQENVPRSLLASDGTLGFRVSSDAQAAALIADYMDIHGAPLTCTSANVSGLPTLPTPDEILRQFGDAATAITAVINSGERTGHASTIVRVIDDVVEVVREGAIPKEDYWQ